MKLYYTGNANGQMKYSLDGITFIPTTLAELKQGIELPENTDYSKIKVQASSNVFSSLEVIKGFKVEDVKSNFVFDAEIYVSDSSGPCLDYKIDTDVLQFTSHWVSSNEDLDNDGNSDDVYLYPVIEMDGKYYRADNYNSSERYELGEELENGLFKLNHDYNGILFSITPDSGDYFDWGNTQQDENYNYVADPNCEPIVKARQKFSGKQFDVKMLLMFSRYNNNTGNYESIGKILDSKFAIKFKEF